MAQLCREAGIHRTTFYGHYGTIDELAVEVFAGEIENASRVEFETDIELTVIAEQSTAATIRVLNHVRQDSEAFQALLQSPLALGFHRKLATAMHTGVTRTLEAINGRGGAPDAGDLVATSFLAGALVGVIVGFARNPAVGIIECTEDLSRLMPAWWPVTVR